jgi:hypothetical protein
MSLIETSPTTPEATMGAATARVLAGAGATANETSDLSMLLGYDTSDPTEGSVEGVDTGGFAANDMDAIYFGVLDFWWFSFSQP